MTNEIQPLVKITNNTAIAASFDVSHNYGLQHENIMYAISKIRRSARGKFRGDDYFIQQSPKTGEYPYYYLITKAGFIALAKTFKKPEHESLKNQYLTAFNAVEATITPPVVEVIKPPQVSVSANVPSPIPSRLEQIILFLDDCTHKNESVKTACSIIYNCYVKWCDSKGFTPASKKFFGSGLYSMGFPKARSNKGGKAYGSIELKKEFIQPVQPTWYSKDYY